MERVTPDGNPEGSSRSLGAGSARQMAGGQNKQTEGITYTGLVPPVSLGNWVHNCETFWDPPALAGIVLPSSALVCGVCNVVVCGVVFLGVGTNAK